MGLSKIARTIATKAGNRLGFYSKKQSVDISINIGKELVDLSRAGKQINKELVQSTIKKHAPNVKVNIITDKDELRQLLKNAGENVENLEAAANGYAALSFSFGKGAKGIFIPSLGTERGISHFAHEFEHYMYNEHTPKRQLVRKTFIRMMKLEEKLKKTKPSNAPKEYDQISLENKIQRSLRNRFGIGDINRTGGLKGVEPTTEGVKELLKGKNFTGLTSDKRVDAYIRTITRHHMNPKNTDSLMDLLLSKNTLDDEARAYGVSDAVNRYISGKNEITWEGLTSEIYKRTSKVLKGEIAKSLEIIGNTNKAEITKKVKTGLPTTSYIGQKARNILQEFLGQSQVAEDEPMVISAVGKAFGKPHKIKAIDVGLFEQAQNANV